MEAADAGRVGADSRRKGEKRFHVTLDERPGPRSLHRYDRLAWLTLRNAVTLFACLRCD